MTAAPVHRVTLAVVIDLHDMTGTPDESAALAVEQVTAALRGEVSEYGEPYGAAVTDATAVEVTRQGHLAPADPVTRAAIDSGRMVIVPVPDIGARTAAAAASPPCPDCGQGWPEGCREDCPSRDD